MKMKQTPGLNLFQAGGLSIKVMGDFIFFWVVCGQRFGYTGISEIE